jgi:hypothetical protein
MGASRNPQKRDLVEIPTALIHTKTNLILHGTARAVRFYTAELRYSSCTMSGAATQPMCDAD